MENPRERTLQKRLSALGVLAVSGLLIWFTVVAALEGTKKIKAWMNDPSPVPLAKKQECSKYLDGARLSSLMPAITADEIAVGGHTLRNVSSSQPVVFYSLILDTCVGVQKTTGTYDNRPYRQALAVDLLTGVTVDKEIDFSIERQRQWESYESDLQQFLNDSRNKDAMIQLKRRAANAHFAP